MFDRYKFLNSSVNKLRLKHNAIHLLINRYAYERRQGGENRTKAFISEKVKFVRKDVITSEDIIVLELCL